jgi:ABC-2 type transport system permease protein
MVMAEILYLKGVVGVSESYSKRKTLSTGDLDKNLIQSSAIRTYTFKELKLLFRTPSYFLNCVLMNFIWPLFLLIPLISQPKLFSEIKKVSLFTQNSQFLAIAVAAGFAVSLFISSSTGITSTAISREGQNLFVGKYIPMRYKSQIMAKVLSGIILNSIGILVALVVAIELVKPPFYLVALIAVVSLLGIMLVAFTGILIDLNFPKLDWDNEQKAVKQNINLMVNMLIGIAIAVVSVMLTKKFKLNIWEAFGGIVGLSGMADIILYSILVSCGEKLYNKIEN